MPPEPIPAPVQALAPDLARRIGLIVAALVALVAHRFLRDPHLKSLINPLCTYLTRTARRFARVMAQIATNRLPKPRPTRPHSQKPSATRPATLPSGHAWLIRALPCEAANYASQLDHLLAEPAVADFLAASPAAARILRPLAHMLGLGALARKRAAPKPHAPAAPRAAPPRRAPIPPLHPNDPSYRPSAKWPRGPWPAPRWPRAKPA